MARARASSRSASYRMLQLPFNSATPPPPMPPRVPLSTRSLYRLLPEPYICASCLCRATRPPVATKATEPRQRAFAAITSAIGHHDILQRTQNHERRTRTTIRRASNGSLASATAINAPSSVPPQLRDLHQHLIVLQDTASSYVDLARLQLAARSLEGDAPTIRVALLGIGKNGPLAARKLAKVLLSDALSDQEPWETEIMNSMSDQRDLLLRFGDPDETVQSNPLIRTMNIPSPYLRRHNLEILVSGLNVGSGLPSSEDVASIHDAVLVPTLTTPNAAGGRVGFVRFPVHKSVLVAEGIEGAIKYGSLPSGVIDGDLICAALSVPLRASSGTESAEEEASTNSIDIDLADHALALFRTDKANGAQFSQEWQTSRVSRLGEWMGGQNNEAATGMRPAVRGLISSVLSATERAVLQQTDTTDSSVTAASVPQARRNTMQAAITGWAADSHRDLQINLDAAFSISQSWRRTSWWRLFWRIDDVTISATEVLHRSWLTESEQALAFLSGRVAEAGLATGQQLRDPAPVAIVIDESQIIPEMLPHYKRGQERQRETYSELTQMPSMLAKMQSQSGVNAEFSPPWPQAIHMTRQYMIHDLVPGLHRKAQGLLLTSASTIGGSAALSVWFYFATGGVGFYESGAIVALGLVWSLRRLQKKWSVERDGFASAVREDARRVVGEVESHLQRLVEDGGRVTVRQEDQQSWQEAREAVSRCRDALQKVGQS